MPTKYGRVITSSATPRPRARPGSCAYGAEQPRSRRRRWPAHRAEMSPRPSGSTRLRRIRRPARLPRPRCAPANARQNPDDRHDHARRCGQSPTTGCRPASAWKIFGTAISTISSAMTTNTTVTAPLMSAADRGRRRRKADRVAEGCDRPPWSAASMGGGVGSRAATRRPVSHRSPATGHPLHVATVAEPPGAGPHADLTAGRARRGGPMTASPT